MEIVTLTLSPAYDIHAVADSFFAERENQVKITSRDAGGKGLNISRALGEYGIKSRAVILLGSEGGENFLRDAASKSTEQNPSIGTTHRLLFAPVFFMVISPKKYIF